MTETLTIADRARNVIAEHLGFCDAPEKVTDDAELRDDLGADSLDLIELAMALEDEFQCGEISDDTVFAWRTAGDLVKTIEGMWS